ncbi:MAG: hypothetical protein GX216_04820 [Methanomicrobiales archaeon]|nr:hypothetical protein [Methanomicrobiales archaeon]
MPPRPRDDALSEVVGFVLILGVIVVALSLYQVYGVPAVGRENEIAHMNHVKNRFVDYKIALDSLWVNDRSGVLLSMAFDLGTGAPATGGRAFALPILTPAGSGGMVTVEEGGAVLNVTAQEGEEIHTLIEDLPLGRLIYQSSNHYWVDQEWIYQGGAIFLSQGEGMAVRVGPSIAVAKKGNNTDLTVAPIRLEGSDMIAGSGPVRIETRMRQGTSSPREPYDWVNLTIKSDDEPTVWIWKRAFDEVRERAKDDWGIDSLHAPELSDDRKRVTLTVKPPGNDNGKVYLTRHSSNYTVTLHGAASLVE